MFPTEQTADHTSLLTRHFNFQCQSLAGYEKNKHGAHVAHMKPQISALGSEIISLAHFIYRKRRSGTGKGDIMGYKCWEDESRVFIKFRSRLGFDRWIKKKNFSWIQVWGQWCCSGTWWTVWSVVFRSDLRSEISQRQRSSSKAGVGGSNPLTVMLLWVSGSQMREGEQRQESEMYWIDVYIAHIYIFNCWIIFHSSWKKERKKRACADPRKRENLHFFFFFVLLSVKKKKERLMKEQLLVAAITEVITWTNSLHRHPTAITAAING